MYNGVDMSASRLYRAKSILPRCWRIVSPRAVEECRREHIALWIESRRLARQERINRWLLLIAWIASLVVLSCALIWFTWSERADAAWHDAGQFEVTAYCPCKTCCGRWARADVREQRTKGGTIPRFGVVAADWSVIPHNSVVLIEGLGNLQFIVEDTGAAIKGRRFDLFVSTHQIARNWGRKTLRVWIWRADEREAGVLSALLAAPSTALRAGLGCAKSLVSLVCPR